MNVTECAPDDAFFGTAITQPAVVADTGLGAHEASVSPLAVALTVPAAPSDPAGSFTRTWIDAPAFAVREANRLACATTSTFAVADAPDSFAELGTKVASTSTSPGTVVSSVIVSGVWAECTSSVCCFVVAPLVTSTSR